MKTRLSASAVLGIAILVACGSSSGGEGDNGLPGPAPATGSGDIPPSDFDTPPGQDPPPGSFDDPTGPSITPPGGTGSGSCASVCQGLIADGCTQTELGANVASCTRNCETGINESDCGPQLLAFLACVVRSPDFSCDVLDGEIQQGQFTECMDEARAYAQCTDNGGGDGGRGGL